MNNGPHESTPYIRRSFQQVEGLLHEEKKRLIRDIAPNGHDT